MPEGVGQDNMVAGGCGVSHALAVKEDWGFDRMRELHETILWCLSKRMTFRGVR